MKNNKLILFAVLFLSFISSGYAFNFTGIVGNWNASCSNCNLFSTGTSIPLTTTIKVSTIDGKIGKGWLTTAGGTDQVNYTYANYTGARSVFMWINTTQTSGGELWVDYKSNWGKELRIDANGTIIFDMFSGSSGSSGSFYMCGGAGKFNSNKLINDGKWHYIGFTYDGTTCRLYVDGNLTNSASAGATSTRSGSGIGGLIRVNYDFQAMRIDELTDFTRNLTTSEIAYLYNYGKGLVYPFVAETYPVISLVTNGTINTNNVTITWTTDINSNTSVNYGTTTALGTKANTNDAVTSHSQLLTSLTAGTLYYYNVTSCASGYCNTSGVYNFTTLPYTNFSVTAINSVSGSSIGTFNLTINGTTYSTTGGQINTTIPENAGLFDVDVWSYGYYHRMYSNYNVSSSLQANITPFLVINLSQYPLNATQFNYSQVKFNVSVYYNGTPTTTLCNLTIDSILEYTQTFTGNGSLFANYTGNLADGEHTYYWECNNEYTGHQFEERTFYTDTIFPTIQTDFINNSIYYLSNITAQFNFTDDQSVFSYNVSIDGTTKVANYINGTTNNATYTLNTAPQQYGIGTHRLTARVADGHTADELKDDYKISEGLFGDVLEVNSNNKQVKIQAKDKSYSDEWTTTKKTDRYTFTYTPNKKSSEKTFVVDCDEQLYVLNNENTEYKTWLVCGDKWIDFKIKGEEITPTIKRNSKNQAEVILKGIKKTDVIEFQSIGELNIREANYTFSVINATYNTPTERAETESVQYTLNLTRLNVSSPSVLFKFNGTNHPVTSTIGINSTFYNTTVSMPLISGFSDLKNYDWNISLATQEYISQNQYITSINISNCTGAINATSGGKIVDVKVVQEGEITIKDNQTTNATFAFFVWAGDGTVQKNFTFSNNNFNETFFCIYTNRTVTSKVDVNYAMAGGVQEYIYTGILNKTTATFYLNIINSATGVVIRVIDQLNNAIVGNILSLYYKNPLTLSYVLSASRTTDYNGNTIFYYNPTSTYKAILYFENSSIKHNFGDIVISSNPTTLKLETQNLSVTNYLSDISYHITPSSNIVTPSDSSVFSITTSSPGGHLTSYGAYSSVPGDNNEFGSTSTGGTETLHLNTSGYQGQTINVNYFFDGDDGGLNINQSYFVYDATAANTSMTHVFGDYGSSINPFYKMIIAIFVSLVIGAGFFALLGSMGASFIAYLVFLFFGVVGFIPWFFPTITGILIILGYIAVGGNEGQ